ncbi:acyl transferase/acyl hydrolase/lysophospholipase [Mycena olivaceomarginata]|nr:acyl transferase/acyl hydrolase/lysophospholipase [Mycena olivaceomarginata]
MYKLKVTDNLLEIPYPCNYFDLIGEQVWADSKKAYGQLAKEVFSDVKFHGSDGKFKASKLEKAIKQIVKTYSSSHNPEDKLEDIGDNACKTLCLQYSVIDRQIVKQIFRFAGRATSAAPTFFKQIKIGPSGIEEAFVDGGMGHNNPTASLISEAKVLFPHHQIACVISLGTGQSHTISSPKLSPLNCFLPSDVVKTIQEIATDCEKEHQSFANCFNGIANFYFRFNVEQGMQNIQLNQWERLGDVAANTRQYIQSQLVTNQLADAAKSLSEKIGKVPTVIEFGQSQVVPTIVKCPPPSQIFQGREDILAGMDDYFSKDIGKRHVHKTVLINASSQQTLDTAFKNIAIANKIGNSLQDTLSWLSSQIEEWMLLFDNADDTSINFFPFFPRCTHGNIIITSRNPQLVAYGAMSHSKVGDMDEANAIDLLLLRAAKEKTPETAAKASEIVKDHARLLKEHPKQSHDDYEWTVYTTWEISFKQLSKVAAELLQMCSLLHHDSIPEAIFEKAAAWTSDNSGDAQNLHQARAFLQNFLSPLAIWNQQSFMDIIAEIAAYSLVDRHSGAILSMHPLVQLWCLNTLADEPKVRECMMDILGILLDSKPSYCRFREAEIIQSIQLKRERQVLGVDHPITLQTMGNLAATYCGLGRYQEAEPLAVTVLEKRKQLLGADHPDTLDTKKLSVFVVTVLEKRKKLFGADHPDTLLAMANLAATYRELGRYQEAEPLIVIVLEKQKQLFGADHPETLFAMRDLAAYILCT